MCLFLSSFCLSLLSPSPPLSGRPSERRAVTELTQIKLILTEDISTKCYFFSQQPDSHHFVFHLNSCKRHEEKERMLLMWMFIVRPPSITKHKMDNGFRLDKCRWESRWREQFLLKTQTQVIVQTCKVKLCKWLGSKVSNHSFICALSPKGRKCDTRRLFILSLLTSGFFAFFPPFFLLSPPVVC